MEKILNQMSNLETNQNWNLEILSNDNLRPVIFQKPTGETRPKKGTTSYVYRLQNKDNNKIYIGYHTEGDTLYRTSSRNDEFKEVLASEIPDILSYEILFWGSVSECKQYEHELLTKVDARNNPDYYNLTNGQSGIKQINIGLINKLTNEVDGVRKFKNNVLDSLDVVEFSIENLYKIERLQTREMEIDSNNLSLIIERIAHNVGSYEMPVILQNIEIDGTSHEYLLISGNHTRLAYYKTMEKNIGHTKNTLLKCVLITDEVHKDLSYTEILLLSNNLNADFTPGKKFTKEDAIKECLEIKKNGHSWKTLEMRNRYQLMGLSRNIIDRVFEKVDDILKRRQWEKEGNMIFNYREVPKHKKKLDEVAAKFEADGYFVIKSSSGNPHLYRWLLDWADTQKERMDSGLPIQEKMMIVVYHNSTRSQDNWPELFKKLFVPQHLDDKYDEIKNTFKLPKASYYEMPMKGKSI